MAHRAYIGEGGEEYPSVTTVLGDRPKPWLLKWFEKHPIWAPKKTKAATNVGSSFHSFVQLGKADGNRRLFAMTSRWCRWTNEVSFKTVQTEMHVVSEMYHYHGTFDAVGTLGKSKELIIFDWKTSSAIYPDMDLQLSAYAQAYKEQTGIEIKRGFIVHVSKDKPNHKLTVKEYKLGKRLFNKFLKRLNEYRDYNETPEGV